MITSQNKKNWFGCTLHTLDNTTYIEVIETPLGLLKIEATTKGVSSIVFMDEEVNNCDLPNEHTQKAVKQLEEYFNKERNDFDFPIDLRGTEFQLKVWNELQNIPFGKSMSYLELSKTIGDVKAIRAVGTTNGKNPIAIVIPCHRVIGSDGSLTGYAGGLHRKKWLLEHEGVLKQTSLF